MESLVSNNLPWIILSTVKDTLTPDSAGALKLPLCLDWLKKNAFINDTSSFLVFQDKVALYSPSCPGSLSL